MEELTLIFHVSEDATKTCENGVIRLGTEVQEGDILIGINHSEGETNLHRKKAASRIFGDKAGMWKTLLSNSSSWKE